MMAGRREKIVGRKSKGKERKEKKVVSSGLGMWLSGKALAWRV